jgi:two-component system copper resistance phosphate regulon response regulator CusR
METPAGAVRSNELKRRTRMTSPASTLIETTERPDAMPKARRITPPERQEPAPAPTGATKGEVKTMRALIIEDNPKMAAAIAHGLEEQGYAVDTCLTGFEGEETAAQNEYDVLILDLMLPDRDGMDVCRGLRRRGLKTPILILSAISATNDKVAGLNAGADDFLGKPFEFEELLARVRALLRRGQPTESATLRVGDLELDLAKHRAKRGDQSIALTSKEFALLEYFMRNPDRVLTRTQIGEHVWDMNFDASSNVIDVYVSMLRRKIDKGFPSPLIHTIIGTGYVFSADRQ